MILFSTPFIPLKIPFALIRSSLLIAMKAKMPMAEVDANTLRAAPVAAIWEQAGG